MKDKLKKIITIIFIVFAILFGFSWVKSCNNAKDIKTYENVAQMHQKAPKKANEQEDNKDYIIFDSNIIEKVEIGQEEYFTENDKVIVDLWYEAPDYEYDIKIYFKKGYAYQETANINDNFIFSTLNNEDIAFNVSEYKSLYNYSTMHINYEYDDPDVAQVTTITLKEELIKHNFDYLTNKSLILNSSLSSQFGNNLINAPDRTGKWWVTPQNDITDAINNLTNGTYTISCDLTALTLDSGYNVEDCLFILQIVGGQYSNGVATSIDTFTSLNQTQSLSLTFVKESYTNYQFRLWGFGNNQGGNHGQGKCSNIMLNKGTIALPYHKYINISDHEDRVRILTKDNSLNDRTFATYFYSNSYKPLIPKEDLIPIISLENNKLGFAIGTGTETTNQPIYDYNDRVYLNGYGFIPRTLVLSNQFNHDNLNCFVLNNYQEGYADYDNEILFTEYILNNSQPFTSEQIDTYNVGYQIGKSDGIYQALEWTNLIKELAKSLESFLNIQILPNITIKLLILVPIMFAILNFIVKLFVK